MIEQKKEENTKKSSEGTFTTFTLVARDEKERKTQKLKIKKEEKENDRKSDGIRELKQIKREIKRGTGAGIEIGREMPEFGEGWTHYATVMWSRKVSAKLTRHDNNKNCWRSSNPCNQ